MQKPTLKDVYQFVQSHSCPFVTANDLSDQFDSVTKRTINSRLNTLHDNGKVEKRELGANAVVWYVRD